MGFGGISVWQLLIILVIVLIIFGTKKLRNVGGDLGGAIKNFKKAVKEEGEAKSEQHSTAEDIEDKSDDSAAQAQDDDDSKAKAEDVRSS